LIFREVLQKAIDNTEGCLGILIMGTDGIAVQKVWRPEGTEFDFDIAVAEYTSLIRNAKRTNNETGLGKLQEVTLMSESGIFILRFASDDYFIAMVLSPEGNFGRGRYELRRAELLLEKELNV
jgi:predicted regulator of Ras-like GTPase activity (Roadblock/LC7/MglB family)